jgi:hypothetical protein
MSTNFSTGVNNQSATDLLGNLQVLDPSVNHTYFNDFDVYAAADWTVTETQAGATQAIANADGGVLLLTNTAADNDLVALQLSKETFKFHVGKETFFKARFKVSDATQSDLVIGLQITDTTPLAVTDGVYFRKDNGDTNLDFVVVKNSTATTASAIATLANATYITVGFVYDGIDSIKYFAGTDAVSPTYLGKLATTNLPDDEELTISFAIQNGEAVAKTMSIDYIFASEARR